MPARILGGDGVVLVKYLHTIPESFYVYGVFRIDSRLEVIDNSEFILIFIGHLVKVKLFNFIIRC